MQIGNLTVWCSSKQAAQLGCTHYAWSFGIIPGFYCEERGLWVSRSDLLNPIEDALMCASIWLREMRGEELDFMFAIGAPIAPEPRSTRSPL